MRKSLTKFGWIFECGAVDACQKRFSWFFNWIPKLQKFVNLVDLVKSFQTCKNRLRYSREGPLKVCQKKVAKSQKIEGRKNKGSRISSISRSTGRQRYRNGLITTPSRSVKIYSCCREILFSIAGIWLFAWSLHSRLLHLRWFSLRCCQSHLSRISTAGWSSIRTSKTEGVTQSDISDPRGFGVYV